MSTSSVRNTSPLLGPADPSPVLTVEGDASEWLLVCDHAGNDVPQRLASLGLSADDLTDHIGIDIGIWAVTTKVAAALGARAIGQRYSRLVIDCNRRERTPASIPEFSDRRTVPGNAGRPWEQSRIDEVFRPYHQAIASTLDAHPHTRLCSMHSFTRELAGMRRAVDVGVIYGPRSTLADVVFDRIAKSSLRVERNVPYQIDFAGDYTLPVHGEDRRLDYVEIEICQDLIGDAAGQAELAEVMTAALSNP